MYPGEVIKALFDYVREMKWQWENILAVYSLVALMHIVYIIYEMEKDVGEKNEEKLNPDAAAGHKPEKREEGQGHG
jgi:hypothetical protein